MIKKIYLLALLALLSFTCLSQDNFISIEANVDQFGPNFDRVFIKAENENNGTHSVSSIDVLSGTDENSSKGAFATFAHSYTAIPKLGGFTLLSNGRPDGIGKGLTLMARSKGGIIKFLTSGNQPENERMRITENGNIGIGTSEPKERLQVSDGDIYLEDIASGVIMKSPDGNCWKGTLDNTGNLNFVTTVCP